MIFEKIGNEKMTAKKIANIVRKVLGFEIERLGHENVRTIVAEFVKLKSLCLYYGHPIPRASVARVAAVANEPTQEEFLDSVEKRLEGVI